MDPKLAVLFYWFCFNNTNTQALAKMDGAGEYSVEGAEKFASFLEEVAFVLRRNSEVPALIDPDFKEVEESKPFNAQRSATAGILNSQEPEDEIPF